ncbi:MAG: hypothetical protein ACPGFA_08205, partial [Pikeienuella sp.]
MLHYIKSVAIAVMLSAPAFISAPASAQPVLFYEDAPDVDDLKRRISLLETDLRNSEAVSQNLSQQNEALRQQMAMSDSDK